MSLDRRIIGVVRQGVVAAANNACRQPDLDPAGGDKTFTVPLRQAGDNTNTVRAYWCSWAMTPAMQTALRNRLQAAGLTAAEVAVVTKAQRASFVPDPTARAYLFVGEVTPGDGGWPPGEVLAVLGLDTIEAA